jgi:hypothetical protein
VPIIGNAQPCKCRDGAAKGEHAIAPTFEARGRIGAGRDQAARNDADRGPVGVELDN